MNSFLIGSPGRFATIPGLILSISLLLLPATAAGAPGAGSFEKPGKRNASDILPPEMISGPHHHVRETVVSNGYMHGFTVDSDFGTFEVTGDGALRKLLNEIRAIAVLREAKKSRAYLDAVEAAGRQPLEFGRNLITNPVDTVSGVPRGVARLFGSAAAGAGEEVDPGQDGTAKMVQRASTLKRQYAGVLYVDPYSSNKVLQRELNSVAWAGVLGSLTVAAALAPVGGPSAVGVKSSREAQQLNELIAAEPPEKLRGINVEKLEKMGVGKELIIRFLDHPTYTPRQETIIVRSLASLEQARGTDGFLEMALQADDEESACFYVSMAQMLRAFNETVSPIRSVSGLYPLVFAKAQNGDCLVPLPLDHAIWNERASRVIPGHIKAYGAGSSSPGSQFQAWFTGSVSPRAKQELEKTGVKVVENVDGKIQIID